MCCRRRGYDDIVIINLTVDVCCRYATSAPSVNCHSGASRLCQRQDLISTTRHHHADGVTKQTSRLSSPLPVVCSILNVGFILVIILDQRSGNTSCSCFVNLSLLSSNELQVDSRSIGCAEAVVPSRPRVTLRLLPETPVICMISSSTLM